MSRKERKATAGRNPDGTFAEGNAGRPAGARNRVTREAYEALEEHTGALTGKVVELALEGDVAALRLALERLVPARKDAPIEVDLPPVKTGEEALAASSAILEAVARGDVTPLEGAALAGLLDGHRRLIEVADFETRLTRLEEKHGKN